MVTDPERAGAYRRAGLWDDATLSGAVADAAGRHPRARPSSTATAARSTAMASWARDVSAVAAWLEARGVGPGDVVSIQLPNWYETVVVAVATQAVGAVINPLLPIYRRRELLHVFTVAASKVVCTPAQLSRLRPSDRHGRGASRSRGAPSSMWSSTSAAPRR